MAPERISVTVTKDTTTVRPSMTDRYRAAVPGSRPALTRADTTMVSTTTDAVASPISERLLEGVPLLVGEAVDRHVVIARKGPRTFQRLIRSDHREVAGFVSVLGDGHPSSVRLPGVGAAAFTGKFDVAPRTYERIAGYRLGHAYA